jgi:hypothetical protein
VRAALKRISAVVHDLTDGRRSIFGESRALLHQSTAHLFSIAPHPILQRPQPRLEQRHSGHKSTQMNIEIRLMAGLSSTALVAELNRLN